MRPHPDLFVFEITVFTVVRSIRDTTTPTGSRHVEIQDMASKVATKVAKPKVEGVRLFVSRLHWTVSSCEYCMAAAAKLTKPEE